LGMCKRKKAGNKIEQESEAPEKSPHQFSVSYADMEKLPEDFNTAQDILKRQLKDKEKREKREADRERAEQEGSQAELREEVCPEDELIASLGELLEFVKTNKDCVDTVLAEDALLRRVEADGDVGAMVSARDDEVAGPEPGVKRLLLQKGVDILLDKQTKKEEEYESNISEAINEQQQAAFSKEIQKTEEMKNKIEEEYRRRMAGNNISPEE